MNRSQHDAFLPRRIFFAPIFTPVLGLALLVAGCGGGDAARVFGAGGTDGMGTGGKFNGNDGGIAGTTGMGGRAAGTGGVIGSGGAVGSGGITGSGGMTGTGGRGGIGGAGARGGTMGAGARGGSGGAAGALGSGGTGGVSAATCSAIETTYVNELMNARICSLASPMPPCQIPVPAFLNCAYPCITYVQNAANLHQIMDNWSAAGCVAALCPLICINAQPGSCAITGMASTPLCQNGPQAGTL